MRAPTLLPLESRLFGKGALSLRYRGNTLLALALLVVARALPVADAFISVHDLREMVQNAPLIVKAKAIQTRPTTRKDWSVATFAVEKTLRGHCDRIIKVLHEPEVGVFEISYPPGRVFYLCLSPSLEDAGMYLDSDYGLNAIFLKNGKVDMTEVPVPKDVKRLLSDRSPANFEAVVRWLLGPRIGAVPVKRVFRYDEPFELRLTMTNPSKFPMKLIVGSADRFDEHFRVWLHDANGFDLHRRLWPDDYEPKSWRNVEDTVTLTRRIRIRVRQNQYLVDPASAQTIRFLYLPRCRRRRMPKDCWRRHASTTIPIRVTCPRRRWAADLQRPNAEWAVSLGESDAWTERPAPGVAPRGTEVVLSLSRPQDEYTMYFLDDDIHPLPPHVATSLAACIRVEHDGRFRPGPKRDDKALRRWLATLRKTVLYHQFKLDLARHFPLDRPGSYRVRVALPGAKRPSLSNVLKVVIPAGTPPE